MINLLWRSLRLAPLILLLLLAGCEGYYGPYGIDSSRSQLRSGRYVYRAWSDYGGRGPTWWGTLQLRVESDGELSGTYRLPGQCSDHFGAGADCVGRVGGRIYRNGEVRLGFDEGWLSHEGSTRTRSQVVGYWETRLLGWFDSGDFELVRD